MSHKVKGKYWATGYLGGPGLSPEEIINWIKRFMNTQGLLNSQEFIILDVTYFLLLVGVDRRNAAREVYGF